MTEPRPHLSIVIPAYNEARRLPATLALLGDALRGEAGRCEVLVVDDGSRDATVAVVEQTRADFPGLRTLAAPHRGKGHAVRLGMLAAEGDFVLFCDADLSVPVEQMLRLPSLLGDAYQVAIASREGSGARREGEPGYRHLMGRVFNLFVQALAVPGIEDTQCGLKCFTRASARAVFERLTVDGFGFDVEALFLARKLGYRVRQVPVDWRHVPQSRVDPVRDTLRMLADVLRVRLNDLRGKYAAPSGAARFQVPGGRAEAIRADAASPRHGRGHG
jgi:dolichyl-phosphate beta-glucosyltransferase